MKNRDENIAELSKLIIETIHGLPYEKALKKEGAIIVSDGYGGERLWSDFIPPIIRIGRVIEALTTSKDDEVFDISRIEKLFSIILSRDWKITKDGKECTIADQTDETITELLKLFTK